MKKSGVFGRTAVCVLAVAVLIVLIVLADITAYGRYREGIVAQEQKQLLLMAETIGQSLKNAVEAEIETVELFFTRRELDAERPEELVELFLSERSGVFSGALIAGADGAPLYSTFTGTPPMPPEADEDGSGARIVGKSLADTGWYELYIRKSVSLGGEPAALLLALDLNELYLKIVAPVRIGDGGYSVVKGRDLAIIMHHAKSQIGMDAIYDRSQRYPDLDLSSLKRWLDLQTREEEGVSVIDSYVWDDPALTPMRRIVAYSTIHIQDERWIVNSTLPIEELSAPLRHMAFTITLVTLLCFGAITAIAVLLTRALAHENAQEREIEYLREINRGMELTAKQSEEIRHYQRVQSLGMMASHIAHEFNNYLTPIAVYAELMSEDESLSEDNRSMVREMLGSIETAKRLSRSLLDYSRQDTGAVLKPMNLTEAVQEALLVVRQLTPKAVTLSSRLTQEPLFILGREGMLQSVLMNLCKNAFSAMEDSERKELRVTLERAGEDAVLRVRDSGCGISEEARRRIFEPFYTTKGSRQGTGLGLSVVENIVKNAGGRIEIQSESAVWTEFSVYLPLTAQEREQRNAPPIQTLLYVGRSPSGVAAVRKAAAAYGCTAIFQEHPAAAIDQIQKRPDCCDLLLAEYLLPAMNGVELLEIARQFSPRVKAVLLVEQAGPDLDWYVNNRIIDCIIHTAAIEQELAYFLSGGTER